MPDVLGQMWEGWRRSESPHCVVVTGVSVDQGSGPCGEGTGRPLGTTGSLQLGRDGCGTGVLAR